MKKFYIIGIDDNGQREFQAEVREIITTHRVFSGGKRHYELMRDRLPEQYRDQIKMRMVRFRTLGCWPLTGAVESDADTIEKIVEEMMTTTKSERTTRVIDFDQEASMEQKKREGYF